MCRAVPFVVESTVINQGSFLCPVRYLRLNDAKLLRLIPAVKVIALEYNVTNTHDYVFWILTVL